jgi:hypothetical protein
MNILNTEWKHSKCLNNSFREALELFYKRMPATHLSKDRWIADENVDDILQKVADESAVDWCVIHGEGVIYRDQCKINHLLREFLLSIQEPILVVGQLIDKPGSYCGLHEQLFAVNMKIYRELGRPLFGQANSGKKRLNKYLAGESIHDGYTPKELSPVTDADEYETRVGGWNLIHVSMANGLRALNIPDDIRAQKIYIYPNDHSDVLNKNLEAIFSIEPTPEIQQSRALIYLLGKKLGLDVHRRSASPFNFPERKKAFFMYNTELHLPHCNWVERNQPKVRNFVLTGAGVLDIANVIGFCSGIENINLVYYDVNEEALAYKKWFWQNISGHSVEEIVELNRTYRAEFPNHIADARREVENIESLNSLVQRSGRSFQDICNQIKAASKKFVNVNLLVTPEKVLSFVPQDQETFMIISDIFLGQNELVYGFEKIRQKFFSFLVLAHEKKNLIIQGKDPGDRFFINYSKDFTGSDFDSMMKTLNRI